MVQKSTSPSEPSLAQLVDGIVTDVQKLVRQQLDLFRGEVQQEIDRAKTAAVSMGAGAGLVALGGVLSAQMLVHGLHKSTRIPLWGCYGLVAGALGATGVSLLNNARKQAAQVRLTSLPQTREALGENLEWLKEQTSPGRS